MPLATHASMIATIVLAAPLFVAPAAAQEESPAAPSGDFARRVHRLVERIATGSESQAEVATERLMNEVLEPLVAALAAIDERPLEEQMRLQRLLMRLPAELEVRVFRSKLPGEQRPRWDRFVEQYPEVSLQLFDPHPQQRLDALDRIPLEPGTGAVLAVAAKVDDRNARVVSRALDLAEKFGDDPVLIDTLLEWLHEGAVALNSEIYAKEEALRLVITDYLGRIVRLLGEAQAVDSVEEITDAIRASTAGEYAEFFNIGRTALALSKARDERYAELLLSYLHPGALERTTRRDDGAILRLTEGDMVLAALLHMYRLPPGSFGVQETDKPEEFRGFETGAQRLATYAAFRKWHAANAAEPPSERSTPPMKVPAIEPTDREAGDESRGEGTDKGS